MEKKLAWAVLTVTFISSFIMMPIFTSFITFGFVFVWAITRVIR